MKQKLFNITVPDGRREIDYAEVSKLAESIKIIGLINPITVSKDNILIAGAHRLEACRHLGFGEVECVVLDCDDLRTELAEIDENFVRNDLDSISVGELAIRRDEILDALGLRAKPHGDGSNQHKSKGAESAPLLLADNVRNYDDSTSENKPEATEDLRPWRTSPHQPLAPLQTTESIAKEMGISERALQVNKQLAKNLVPEAKAAIREKSIPKSAALEISRLKPEKQREVVAKKDKKAIMAEVQKKERQAKGGGATKPRKKTIAQDKSDAVDFAEVYRQWLKDPAGKDTPTPEQNEEGILKIPLPLHHAAMYQAFWTVFGKESEEVRNRVISEVEALHYIIGNLND
jgi:ParB family chromosome partitioning protein